MSGQVCLGEYNNVCCDKIVAACLSEHSRCPIDRLYRLFCSVSVLPRANFFRVYDLQPRHWMPACVGIQKPHIQLQTALKPRSGRRITTIPLAESRQPNGFVLDVGGNLDFCLMPPWAGRMVEHEEALGFPCNDQTQRRRDKARIEGVFRPHDGEGSCLGAAHSDGTPLQVDSAVVDDQEAPAAKSSSSRASYDRSGNRPAAPTGTRHVGTCGDPQRRSASDTPR
jgi:hypothetical protein